MVDSVSDADEVQLKLVVAVKRPHKRGDTYSTHPYMFVCTYRYTMRVY